MFASPYPLPPYQGVFTPVFGGLWGGVTEVRGTFAASSRKGALELTNRFFVPRQKTHLPCELGKTRVARHCMILLEPDT